MIQSPKHEFSRKPKKILSREKQLVFASGHPSAKLKTKESEEGKVSIEKGSNNGKSDQLISNLRIDLLSLRYQVAKLSKKQSDVPDEKQQKILNRVASPAYIKKGVSTRIKDLKETLSQDRIANRLNGKDKEVIVKDKNLKALNSLVQLKEAVYELQLKNRQLQEKNDQLVQRLKNVSDGTRREAETRQKQRPSQHKQLETDRTINFQKQLRQKMEQIDELKQLTDTLTSTSCKLVDEMNKLKEESSHIISKKQLQISQKDKEIEVLKKSIESIKSERQLMEKMKKQIAEKEKQYNTAQVQVEQLKKANKQLLEKAESILKVNLGYKKLNDQLAQKLAKASEKEKNRLKADGKSNSPQRVKQKQLTQIIRIQQKSLQNQLSDINYLQRQVQKLSSFKQIHQNQSKLIEQLTAQLVRMNIISLNYKYAQ